jgi:hypothetical protein
VRVKMRTTAAGPWGNISAGHIGTVPDVVGRAMVSVGSATEVKDYPYEEPTVIIPPETHTATAEATESTVMDPPRRRRKRATVQQPGVSQGDKRPARDNVP